MLLVSMYFYIFLKELQVIHKKVEKLLLSTKQEKFYIPQQGNK